VFTNDDADVFAHNKRQLERAIENREREMRQQGQGTSWAGRTRSSTPREQPATEGPQDIPIDPRLIDLRPLESTTITDE
jgi:hypothetical protein